MSRVDEALRRAAETARRDDATAASVPPMEGAVERPTHESFPTETPARQIAEPIAMPPISEIDELELGRPVAPPVASVEPAAIEPATVTPSPVDGSLFRRLDSRLAGKIVADHDMVSGGREQYRRLAATLHHQQSVAGVKVIMIASAVIGEGKTLTASNLALTLSESYQRDVLLIDADLRRPSLHTLFRMPASPGLSEGLAAAEDQKLAVHQISARLALLSAGKPTSDPMAGLTSPRMRTLIEEAKATFDWIVIDTPPVGLLTDASLLASMVDAAILVVQAGATPYNLVKRAVDAIGPSRVVGVVLNRARVDTPAYGYGYDYYHVRPAQVETRQ